MDEMDCMDGHGRARPDPVRGAGGAPPARRRHALPV